MSILLRSLVLCLLTMPLGLGPVSAAIVFSEDFEAYDLTGGAVSLNTGNSVFSNLVAGGSFEVLDQDPPPLQGGGSNPFTSSQYLRYEDGNQTSLLRAPVSLAGQFWLSFDYFEPNETAGTQTALRVLLSNGVSSTSTAANGVRAMELNINVGNAADSGTLHSIGTAADGTVNPFAAFTANTLMHVDVIGNLSPGMATYGGPGTGFPTGSIDQYRYDVYLNGVLALEGAGFRNQHDMITELALASSGTAAAVQTSYLDNIVIRDSVPSIPEPGTWLLAGLGFLGVATARRHGTLARAFA